MNKKKEIIIQIDRATQPLLEPSVGIDALCTNENIKIIAKIEKSNDFIVPG